MLPMYAGDVKVGDRFVVHYKGNATFVVDVERVESDGYGFLTFHGHSHIVKDDGSNLVLYRDWISLMTNTVVFKIVA